MDIERRAINIPLDFQMEGLVLEINITNCDGTKYQKKHQYHPLKSGILTSAYYIPLPHNAT